MAVKKKATYNEDTVEVLLGLDGIRRKPSMYIGDLEAAPWTCVREVADNCQDEFLAGRNDSCLIVYDGEYVWVADKGDGIPVGMKTLVTEAGKIKESALTSILSRVHAGGKFSDKAYKISAGTHGVGIKAVNALSEEFDVWTNREGQWWHTSFSKGKEVKGVAKCKAPKIEMASFTAKQGTVVRFKLDKTIFPKDAKFNSADAHAWADFNTHLNAGFKVVVVDKNGATTYHHPDGLWSLIERTYNEQKQGDMSYDEIIGWGGTGIEVALANGGQMWYDFAFVMAPNVEGEHLDVYTNGVTNPDGGVHRDVFWSAMGKAILEFAPKRSSSFSINDIKEGVIGLLNVKINEPQFNNQTKEKLVDTRVKKPLEESLYEQMYEFFRNNKAFVKDLCERASELAALRGQQSIARKALLTIKKAAQTKPAKFAGAVGNCPKESLEVFLVEGDSAGGSAKQARFKNFQAVLPLKGKPLNAMKHPDAKVLISEEVMNIFNCIGYIPDGKSSPDGFGKLILLSDSDDDGYHINALILALIQKYMPELFDQGKVFTVDTRNLRVVGRGRNGAWYFGSNPAHLAEQAENARDKIQGKPSYLKGWGELGAQGLREAAMNPETRKLIRLTGLSKKQIETFNSLMGEDVAFRKNLLGIEDDAA